MVMEALVDSPCGSSAVSGATCREPRQHLAKHVSAAFAIAWQKVTPAADMAGTSLGKV